MQTKRILSMILALVLVVGVLAPCGTLVHAATETMYGENLEQVAAPAIGETYYLGADVNGTMMYFRHGAVTDTVPYSLVVTDNINHNWTAPVTLEDPSATDEKYTEGFQLTYIRPDNQTQNRIYCYDVMKTEGNEGIMDTGAHAATNTVYKNRHNFYIDDLDGLKLIKSTGNGNVLVVKQVPQTTNGETKNVWRMLGVPVEELANEGVYPVMLLKEHAHNFNKYASGKDGHKQACWCGAVAAQSEAHTFGEPVVNGNVATRSCTVCGYDQIIYDQKVAQVDEPVVGKSYHLTANVNGTLRYFIHGTVSETSPASLRTSEDIHHNWAFPVVVEAPVEGDAGFQMTYTNPSGTLARIYCYDSIGSDGVADTGANSQNKLANHTFVIDEVNGQKVIRKLENNCVLVVKEMAYSRTVKDAEGNATIQTGTEWRILGVSESELANEGVYPVVLTEEHTHTYGEVVTEGDNVTSTCICCGYEEIVYGGKKLVKADDAVVGNSYYLAADAEGTMVYFRHGTATDTAPYSLVATTNSVHNWILPVTLEDPTTAEEGTDVGFQLTYNRPDTGALTRIYCYDVLKDTTEVPGQTGVMDTGINTANYKGRHTFMIDEVNGVKVLRKLSNNNILVAKYNETKGEWRMLGVPEAELANEGVYPVFLMVEHAHETGEEIAKITDNGHSKACWCGGAGAEIAHTFTAAVYDAANKTHTRVCTACSYVQAVYAQAYEQVKTPAIGGTYYLSANVNGTLKYFCTPPSGGSVTNTSPYSLYTTEAAGSSVRVTLLAAIASGKGQFQLSFDNAGAETFIYCHTTGAGATKTCSTTYYTSAKASVYMDEVNGVSVLRKYGNDYVLVVKQLQNTKTGSLQWHMQFVPEAELANEGVYPAMLTVEHEHTYSDAWTFDETKGTQSKLCTACGFAGETLYGTDVKGAQVTEPVIGNSYYLAANAGGKLIFFRHGVATDTAPYSLVATDNFNHNWVLPVTIEDPTTATEGTEVGFQMTYTNPTTDTLARIYCYDVLKDTTEVPGQTGVMDTGINSVNYKGRHTFEIAEVNGVKVLRKLSNNNILVAKYNETKGEWRMLGVPEAELANEGVYPVMLMNVHEHSFGNELVSDSQNHWYACDCGYKKLASHSYGDWTLDPATMQQSATCTVCGYAQTASSPYFDTVDSEEELNSGLAETVYNEEAAAYTVSGGKDYFLMTEINGQMYYLRNAGKTEAGNAESVLTTSGYSLYTTNDPNNVKILKTKVTKGNTEGTYVIYSKNDNDRAIYVNDEGKDGIVDTGLTQFRGIYNNALYLARSEFMWDAETGYLYQNESGVKYVLVIKQMTATYTTTDATTGETVTLETANEWRMIAVPMADAVPEKGNYPVKLTQHVHNLTEACESEGASYWRTCGCGYKAMIDWTISLSDNIGVSFNLTMDGVQEVKITVAGEEVPAQLVQKSNRVYSVFVPLAAAQMNDQIIISVDGYAIDQAFTVRAYADRILASADYSDAEKNLVRAMLNYGSAAQNFFGYNTGALAGEGIDVSVEMPAEALGVGVQDDLSGVQFYGASIVHENATAVRFYFTADSIEGLTFTESGNVYEPISKDGMYYIEVSGISAQNLNQVLNVVVSDGENNLAVSYSPLAYITRTYYSASTSAELKNLVQALYGYHKAAKAYIANMYLGNDFALKSQKVTSLYEGVSQYKSVYVAADYGEVEAYAIVIKAEAGVELKVSAGAWSESSTAANPGQTKTVVKHFRDMKNSGENVLAMINGGFFDLNTGKTMKPYGMQIVDGVVYQAPAAGNYSDNWFGMTKEGKYVISDAAGYESTYAGNVQQGVGGGKLLMIDGVVQNLPSNRDYRTAVGVNAEGDLVLVAVEAATYSNVNQIFVDLNMDIVTVLNLDGGGSTAMYVPGMFYPKALILGEDGLLPREVADAVAIVVKD